MRNSCYERNMEFPAEAKAVTAWADAWVVDHRPIVVRDELLAFELDHRERFMTDYGRGVEQFYVEFDALVRMIDAMNFMDRDAWPRHRTIQYMLVAKNLNAFHSAMDRLSKGFYVDAMSLVRGLYDCFLRIVHVSLHSDDPWGAVMDKPPAPTPGFNATSIVRDQLRLDWISNYSIMSVFAHANAMEVLVSIQAVAVRTAPPEHFGLSLEPDQRLVETVLPLLYLVMLLDLRLVNETFGGTQAVDETALVTTSQEAVQLLTFSMRSHPKPKWTDVADDINYVLDVLAVADVGGDWRALRNARPVVESRR